MGKNMLIRAENARIGAGKEKNQSTRAKNAQFGAEKGKGLTICAKNAQNGAGITWRYFAEVRSQAAMARRARPRWEMAFLISSGISATVHSPRRSTQS